MKKKIGSFLPAFMIWCSLKDFSLTEVGKNKMKAFMQHKFINFTL
jgi:hypothetical protein